MNKIMQKISKYLESLSMIFLVVLFASVLIQIIMRNFFNSGSVQVEELARFCLVSLVFLMGPVLVIDNQHIFVDLLLIRLPGKIRRYFEVMIQFCVLCFTVILLFSVRQVMIFNWSVKTPALRMPNYILYIPIVLGLVCMATGSVVYMIEAIRKKGESA